MQEPYDNYLDAPMSVASVEPVAPAPAPGRPQPVMFRVTMNDFVGADITDEIVKAAADRALNGVDKTTLRKDIEKRIADGLTERLDAAVAGISKAVLDEPTHAGWSKEPTTMREILAICGKDYLTALVMPDSGKPVGKDSYDRRHAVPRLEYLTREVIAKTYDRELRSAVASMQTDLRASVKAAINALIEEQKALVRQNLATILKP